MMTQRHGSEDDIRWTLMGWRKGCQPKGHSKQLSSTMLEFSIMTLHYLCTQQKCINYLQLRGQRTESRYLVTYILKQNPKYPL
jgi:hypothetical protein